MYVFGQELQSQNWRNVLRSPVSSCSLQTHLPLTQHIINGLMEVWKSLANHPHTQISELTGCAGMDFPLECFQMRVCDPIVELKNTGRELHGGIVEDQGPHTSTSFRRRPEEDHKSRQWVSFIKIHYRGKYLREDHRIREWRRRGNWKLFCELKCCLSLSLQTYRN